MVSNPQNNHHQIRNSGGSGNFSQAPLWHPPHQATQRHWEARLHSNEQAPGKICWKIWVRPGGELPSLKLTVRTWKWMVGKLVSFWDGLFSGAMLVSVEVGSWNPIIYKGFKNIPGGCWRFLNHQQYIVPSWWVWQFFWACFFLDYWQEISDFFDH